uniref:Epidermal growth factor receptor pathway substrate 15-like 1a n=1 Tax=Oryzias sinensis TaxID=183150 RepID=A0A8C7XPD3_9TELE
KKTDTDNDGLVTGGDVIEIFMQSTLSQTMLAQIWGLADTKHTGKLTREQFCLAMHLIHQKSTKGIDPPSSLTPDMIPPSERTESSMDLDSLTGSLELTGVKDLDDLSKEIRVCCRLQSMQHDVEQESSGLQDLESQQRDARGRLQEMEQQRSKLDGMLHDVKHKCQEESQLIASMQSQIRSQEAELRTQEDELSRTKSELNRLQAEEAQLEQRLLSTRIQLETIVKSLKGTQGEISQARTKLTMIQENQREITKTIEEYNSALSSISSGNLGNLPDLSDGFMENGSLRVLQDDSFKARIAMFNSSAPKEPAADPFQIEDPFRSDLLKDPFGDDPFKESDPFRGASSEDFFKTDRSDLFGSADPFAKRPAPPLKVGGLRIQRDERRFPGLHAFSSSEPFSSTGPKPRDSGTPPHV